MIPSARTPAPNLSASVVTHILLGVKPAIEDKAWYETLHSPEIANGGPYMIRLCIDHDFPVN